MNTFILMPLSRKRVDFLRPDPESIDLRDIDHNLNQLVRFQGCSLTVARHSAAICELVRRWGYGEDEQRAALAHDFHEAYLGDLPTPLKASLRSLSGRTSPLDEIANRLDRAIFDRFGIKPWDGTKPADRRCFEIEAWNLFGQHTAEVVFGVTSPPTVDEVDLHINSLGYHCRRLGIQ